MPLLSFIDKARNWSVYFEKMAESEGASAVAEDKQGMNLKALVIGGTGAVGRCLVGELLSSKVKIL